MAPAGARSGSRGDPWCRRTDADQGGQPGTRARRAPTSSRNWKPNADCHRAKSSSSCWWKPPPASFASKRSPNRIRVSWGSAWARRISPPMSACCPTPTRLLYPKQHTLFAARAAGILPMGFVGSIADFRDQDAFRAIVRRSKRLGFVGASAIHPLQVPVLNEEFSPDRRGSRTCRTDDRRLRRGLRSRPRCGAVRRRDDRRPGRAAGAERDRARGGNPKTHPTNRLTESAIRRDPGSRHAPSRPREATASPRSIPTRSQCDFSVASAGFAAKAR